LFFENFYETEVSKVKEIVWFCQSYEFCEKWVMYL
jgi:hypothetical protein